MRRMMKALVFPSSWGVELVYPEAMVNSKEGVDYWNAALDLIAGSGGHKLELEELITKRISLAEAVKAFEFYDRGEWIKILVEPFRDWSSSGSAALGGSDGFLRPYHPARPV
jgi:hypothetical protein